jgi:hypothetical protein
VKLKEGISQFDCWSSWSSTAGLTRDEPLVVIVTVFAAAAASSSPSTHCPIDASQQFPKKLQSGLYMMCGKKIQ